MAIDALRLRNVIQLLGILSMLFFNCCLIEHEPSTSRSISHCTLRRRRHPNTSDEDSACCDGRLRCVTKLYCRLLLLCPFDGAWWSITDTSVAMWRKRHTFWKSWTFPYRCTLYHCCILARHGFLDQTAVRWIWVSRSIVHVVRIIYQFSWAIFHVVGANPKMKSKIRSINMLTIASLITYSYVSMVSNHDLPVEIWLLFLHWCDDPSLSSQNSDFLVIYSPIDSIASYCCSSS